MEVINDANEDIIDLDIAIDSDVFMSTSNNNLPLAQGEVFIEEITRNHKLLHRHRLSQNTISIGRDYNNDIILTDPHICPQHLSLSFSEGTWHIHDNDSINGTVLENSHAKKKNAHQQTITDGDVIIVGKSQLRILLKNHAVAKTIAFSPFEYLIDFIRNPMAVFTAIAIFMLIAANSTYLNQPTETNISQLFVGAFSKGLLFALWPIGVALVSHITKHEPRLLAQFGISFTFFILMFFMDFIEEVIAFNSASNSILSIFMTLLTIGITFSLFWLNSYIGFHVSAKRRFVVALSITFLLVGGIYLLQYSKKPEFNPHPLYNSTIMAPIYLIAPSNNVDNFIQESNKLFEEASKAAQED